MTTGYFCEACCPACSGKEHVPVGDMKEVEDTVDPAVNRESSWSESA